MFNILKTANRTIDQSRKLMARTNTAILALTIFMVTSPAMASSPSSTGSGLPWEDALDKILTSVQGPVARALILISVIVTGLGLAFGEHGSGMKKVMGIAFGGAVVIGATSFVSTLFGASI
jgi:type IV secretion system protein VirB2